MIFAKETMCSLSTGSRMLMYAGQCILLFTLTSILKLDQKIAKFMEDLLNIFNTLQYGHVKPACTCIIGGEMSQVSGTTNFSIRRKFLHSF